MDNLESLKCMCLAPYIMMSTSLIGVSRKCGGNQFRHQFATLGILIDYKFLDDPVLLKASILHDFVEDLDGADRLDEIRQLDSDGPEVVKLILEVTKSENETKEVYLDRILYTGSIRAKKLKCADRISNLTDLHLDSHTSGKIEHYLDQTEIYILPMAREVRYDFEREMIDLIIERRKLCNK